MKRLISILVFLLLPALAAAQVTFDAASSQGVSASLTNTFSHTTSGSNRLLIVGVANGAGPVAVSSVTYGGEALTLVTSCTAENVDARVELWRRIAPLTGLNNVVVTLPSTKNIAAGAVSFAGVDQSTPLGTCVPVNGVGSSQTVDVIGETNGISIDALGISNSPPLTVGADQTTRIDLDNGDGEIHLSMSTESGIGTKTHSWSWTGGGQYSGLVAVPIKPVATGGGSAPMVATIVVE